MPLSDDEPELHNYWRSVFRELRDRIAYLEERIHRMEAHASVDTDESPMAELNWTGGERSGQWDV